MARSLVTLLAIVMVVVLALLARDWIVGAQSGIAGFVPPVLDDRSVFEIAAMFVLALFGFTLLCWALLEHSWALNMTMVGVAVAWVMVWLYFDGDLVQIAEFLVSDVVRWSGAVLAIAIAIGTLLAFRVASRRKLIDTAALVWTAGLFPLAVVSLWAGLLWMGAIEVWPGLREGLYILGVAALVFLPLPVTPLSIASLRNG